MAKRDSNSSTTSEITLTVQRVCQGGTILATLFIILLCVGCSRRYDEMPAYLPFSLGEYDNESVGRFKTSYLAEQIDHYYRGVNPGPLGITTFANLDDLYSTSSFGRMVSEQLMSELTMRGFDVVELRHGDALQFVDASGEFALSRDIGSVRHERQLGGVIVGTYVVSPVRVYVNARLINPSTSVVLSAASVEMDKTRELTKLLRGGSTTSSLERIPVKHLGFETYPAAFFAPRIKAYDAEEDRPAAPAPELPPAPPEKGAKSPTVVQPKLPVEHKEK